MKIKFFWIAEYDNGECLPQFDLETGKENLFKNIEFKHLIRFGWYPFTIDLSLNVENSIINPLLNRYILNIKPGDKLFARRRVHIQRIGKFEKKYAQYLLGNQYFTMIIDENGNCEIKESELK